MYRIKGRGTEGSLRKTDNEDESLAENKPEGLYLMVTMKWATALSRGLVPTDPWSIRVG